MSAPLRIAVPRGALMADTLDLLDRLGIDTAEVRANDRKLLFAEPGIVTMRPSDVSTSRRSSRSSVSPISAPRGTAIRSGALIGPRPRGPGAGARR